MRYGVAEQFRRVRYRTRAKTANAQGGAGTPHESHGDRFDAEGVEAAESGTYEAPDGGAGECRKNAQHVHAGVASFIASDEGTVLNVFSCFPFMISRTIHCVPNQQP
jgi:hypothetical protein